MSESKQKLDFNKLLDLPKFDKDQALMQYFTQIKAIDLKEFEDFDIKEEWRVVYERVRFENDDRTAVPLLICKFITCTKGSKKTLFDIQFFICIFDFYDEAILCKQKLNLQELHTSHLRKCDWQSYVKNLTLTQCSRIVEKKKDQFQQEFQIGYYFIEQNRVQIIQFSIDYDYKQNMFGDHSISLIGGREVFFRGHLNKFDQQLSQMIELLPALNEFNQIIGSQLVFVGNESSGGKPIILIFDNQLDNNSCMPSCVLINKQGYKLYRDACNCQVSTIVAYVTLNEEAFDNESLMTNTNLSFDFNEKWELIRSSLKAILNTVIFDPVEPMKAMTLKQNPLDFSKIQIGRPFELLNWFSIISVSNKSLKILEQMLKETTKSKDQSDQEKENIEPCIELSSLIERVVYCNKQTCINQQDQNQRKHEKIKLLKNNGILIQNPGIIQKDIYHSSLIKYYCKSNDNLSDKGLEIILNSVLNSKNYCSEAHYHLMSNMVNLINYLDSSSIFFSKFICQNQRFDFFTSQTQEALERFCGEINMQQKIFDIEDYFSFSDKELQIVCLDIEDELFFHNFKQLLNDNSQRQIIKQKFYKGKNKTYPIQCTILDLRPNIYNTKINLLKQKQSKIINERQYYNQSQINIYGKQQSFVHQNVKDTSDNNSNSCILNHSPITKLELMQLIQNILNKSNNCIKNQEIIRDIIDCQYQSARKRFNTLFLIYVLLFIIPYLVQIFSVSTLVNQVCHTILMFMNHVFIAWEIAQLKNQGFRNYFNDFWNYVDCAIYIQYLVIFVLQHIHDKDHELINDVPKCAWIIKANRHQHLYVLILPLMNLSLIILLALKMLYFLKNFESTSSEVEIIFYCVYEAQSLIFFMFSTVICYTLFQIILGSNYESNSDKSQSSKQYAALPEFMQIFLQNWINSIGEVDTPRYEVWSDCVQSSNDSNKLLIQIHNVYIAVIWIVWLSNNILSEVIMLNFIIAVVSDIYRKLQLNHLDVKYRNKCHVNTKEAVLDQALLQVMSSIYSNISNQDSNHLKSQFNLMVIFKATGLDSYEVSTLDQNQNYEEQIKNNYSVLLEKFMNQQTQQSTKYIRAMMSRESQKNKNQVQQIENDLERDVHEIKKKIMRIQRQISRNKEQKVNQISLKQDQKFNNTLINRNQMKKILNNQRQGISRSKKINMRVPLSKYISVDSEQEQRSQTPIKFQEFLNDSESSISDQDTQQLQKPFTKNLKDPILDKSVIRSKRRSTIFLSFQETSKVQQMNSTTQNNNLANQLVDQDMNEQFTFRRCQTTNKKIKIRPKSNNKNNTILTRLIVEDESGKQTNYNFKSQV